jgi:alpha-tubulin suppressor-like RCC1 family protein
MAAYPGGLITLNPPATTGPGGIYSDGGSASGMWKLDQALVKQKQSLWPTKIKSKAIYGWGRNSYGELGDNANIYRSSPVQLTSDTWATVKAGSIATKNNGTLWTWGRAVFGALGNNSTSLDRSSPVQLGANTDWGQNLNSVSHGYFGRFAIKTNGTMYTWGYGTWGTQGLNNTISNSSPVQIGTGTTWSQVMGNGYRNNGAIKTDGSLWLWGFNSKGGIGQNDLTIDAYSSPVQVAGSWLLATPGYHTCAGIRSDNTLWTWGGGNYGQLGLGDIENRSSPVQVAGSWVSVAMTNQHCLGIKTGGTLWSWGAADYGRLGSNSLIFRSSPGQVGALTTWSKITCGSKVNGALKSDGTVWTWGRARFIGINEYNNAYNRSSPVQLGSNTDWALINVSQYTTLGVRAS